MGNLHDTLKVYVDDGTLPGAVALVAHGNDEELAAVGSMAVGGAPMARDSIFRLASITKPITAAAVLMLVQDGRLTRADDAEVYAKAAEATRHYWANVPSWRWDRAGVEGIIPPAFPLHRAR